MFKTPQEVYGELARKGEYEEANLDYSEVSKVKRLTLEDYEYAKRLRNGADPNWRVIFNIHYDVLRELCDQLMRFKRQKISNHQGLFAFIILNFDDLDLDWEFFETIRGIRNNNKYKGADISKESWNTVKFQMDLYISCLIKELDRLLEN